MSAPLYRICIVGISGSGKTTLARRLARESGYRHIDLDKIRYPTGLPEASPAQLQARVATIAAEPSWIAEGSYTQQMSPLLAAADRIIWLDTGAGQAAYRIIRRHMLHRLQRRPRFPTSTLKLAYLALSSNHRGELPWRHEIELELEPYARKAHRIGSIREARRFKL